jgi:hypothetical protein
MLNERRNSMSKLQWFISSLIIMTGSFVFLSLFTYSGTIVHSIWFEEERFEAETKIANMDISDLNQEEATLELQQEVHEWRTNHSIELRWFDKKIAYPVESLNFLVDETIENMMTSEELNDRLIVSGVESQLLTVLDKFEFYPDVSGVVFLEDLLDDLEEEVSSLPNGDIVINVHDYVFDNQVNQQQTIYSTTRLFDSPVLEESIAALSTITIEADSHFSLLESVDEASVELLTEKPLSVLASAIYEVLLHSNFSLVERVQSDAINEDLPLGYNVKIDPEQNDLVFENPNPIDYQLDFQYENNQLSVEFVGEEFPYLISVDLENQETINPRTIVQYSDDLPKGSSRVVDAGKAGINYDLVRMMTNLLDDESLTQQLAQDYYPPIHRIELRSKEDLVAEEEEDLIDPGSNEFFDGSDGDPWNDDFPPSEDSEGEQSWNDGNRSEPGSGSNMPGDFREGDQEYQGEQGGNPSQGGSLNDEGNQDRSSFDDRGSSGTPEQQDSPNNEQEDDQAPPPVFPKYDDDGHPIKGY